MLHEMFYWVFNMSITAAITGLAVMLVGRVKKIPRRIAVLLWAIPFLRMVFPFGLNSSYSLLSLLSGLTAKTVVVYEPAEGVVISALNSVMAAETYFPVTYKAGFPTHVFYVASTLWIVVAMAILLTLTVTYITTIRELKDAVHLKNNLYFSEKILSPAVYGIVKPKIILPAAWQDTELVILHERMHIRCGDNLWRMLAFGITAVHWFNPLSWLFLRNFLRDLELACDERVLGALPGDRRKDYALTLLESRQATTVFASAFGGAGIRTRIENILSFKKMTWFSLGVFMAMVCVMFCMLLTNGG